MSRATLHVWIALAALLAGASRPAADTSIPGRVFAFFAPSVSLDPADRRALDAGQVVARVLSATDRDLSVFAAVRTAASGDALIAWTRDIADMQRGPYVPAVGRFSSPPRLDDLAALPIDEGDLDDIRGCRPGACGVKLSAGEIAALQARIGHRPGPEWRAAAARGLREVMVERARGYLSGGDARLPAYHDEKAPVAAAPAFASLMHRLGFLRLNAPGLVDYLEQYPSLDHPDVLDSFLYWSTESLGVKPITSVTHVSLMRGNGPGVPEAMSISKQVFATHYRNAAVSVTAIVGASGTGRYLVYVHRSQVDVLDGVFGGLIRRMIERRVRDEAPRVLDAFRRRLEAGVPR